MKLTENFTLEELTKTNTGLDNTPTAEIVLNLKRLAEKMEEVRAILGSLPIKVNSGYRSPKVNVAVGSKSKNSSHIFGLAADFTCKSFGAPKDICMAIANSNIKFDQLIHEFGSWVHLSIGGDMRQQLLTIDSSGTRHGIFEVRK